MRFFRALRTTGVQIPIAVGLAIIIGVLVNKTVEHVPPAASRLAGLPGNIWIRALKSVVVPLILVSMISSMQSLKKIPGGGGKIISYAMWYFVLTTILALGVAVLFSVTLLGRKSLFLLSLVSLNFIFSLLLYTANMKPVDLEELSRKFPDLAKKPDSDEKEITLLDRTLSLIMGIIPDNLISVMANNDLIAVITMGTVIGFLAKDTPENPSVIMKFVNEVTEIVTHVVNFLIKISPIGIFSLIIPHLLMTAVEKLLEFVGWYFITFFAAIGFMLFIVYPLLYFVIARKNPYHFFKHFMPTALTALGTGSSAACMPSKSCFGVSCVA